MEAQGDLTTLDIRSTTEGLNQKSFSSVEVTQAYLNRIAAADGDLHAYLTVATESALAEAAEADRRRAGGESGALLGVPIAVKDVIMTLGIRTTAASKILEHYQPSFDATAVARLRRAGAVLLGKTNLDEFAHGASTENSAFGTSRNPWDTARVPGGSSGGSAVAVAADLCAGALGTDTGGSIRHPAGFTGIVGLKPSYGRVSRSGLLSMTSSTDVIGPMTKSVADAAILLGAMAGKDNRDQTTAPDTPASDAYTAALAATSTLDGSTVGIPRAFVSNGVAPAVMERFTAALDALKERGARIVDVDLPHAGSGIAVYYVITPCEISANLARFDGIRYGYSAPGAASLSDVYRKSRGQGFGPEVKRRIMLGTYALSAGYYDAYYVTAQKVRTVIVRELDNALRDVNFIATPTAPHVAFPVGEQSDDPLKMYLEDIFMSPASLAGLPAISVPCGLAAPAAGGPELPVGLQLIGRRFGEADLLAAAHVFEQATEWHTLRPTR